MLDFLEQQLPEILAMIVAVAGAVTSVVGAIKMFKSEKRVKASEAKTREDIQITQNGIVEAFKTSKIGSEWKVDVSKQIDKKLENWSEKFLTMFAEHEELRTKLAVANTKILAYTAAFDKLSAEDKAELNDLLKEITSADSIIEV